MGADGRENRSDLRRECYTKLLILLEFLPVLGLPANAKKAKIQATLIVMFHPFFLPLQSAKPKLGFSISGTRLRGGLYRKG
jgi:hypothetical protein